MPHPFKLTFQLKQHTPLLHFQHDQDGATLRASEVKPKLDRFMLEDLPKYWPEIKIKHQNGFETIRIAFDSKKSSPYQMQIYYTEEDGNDIRNLTKKYYFDSYIKDAKNVQQSLKNNVGDILIENIISPAPFFSNRDKLKDKKWNDIRLGILYIGEIILEIKSFNTAVKELLFEVIPMFFVIENFGMRQSKGFGSYVCKDMNKPSQIEFVLKKRFKVLKKKVLADSDISISDKFIMIDKTYRLLKNYSQKSGDKRGNLAKIKQYFEEDEFEPIIWEQEFISKYAKDYNKIIIDKPNVKYVRALLGLAGLYDYPQMTPKKTVVMTDSSKEYSIERFQSPIRFKVFNKTIYVFAYTIPDEVKDHIFNFKEINSDKILQIATPVSFSVNDFLKKKLNWQDV